MEVLALSLWNSKPRGASPPRPRKSRESSPQLMCKNRPVRSTRKKVDYSSLEKAVNEVLAEEVSFQASISKNLTQVFLIKSLV
jgi:hypothetical protein